MPKRKATYVDSFEALDLPKRPTYEQVKREALRVGRFSIFEATATPNIATLFYELSRDPEVVIEKADYPWTKVRHAE